MACVSIVGVRGSGKTTALVLLHESLVVFANRNKKGFRFESDLTSSPYIYDSVRKMRQGDWPDAPVEGYPEEVKLKLRFKKTFGWNETEIDCYDISGEDLENVVDALSDTSRSTQEVMNDLRERKTLAALRESDVFIFIVDSLVCDESNTQVSETKKAIVDTFLGHLCFALQQYKKGTGGTIKAIGLVFTKYDMTELILPLGKVDYDSVENRAQLKNMAKEAQQNRSFGDVMKTYLPSTYNNLNFTLKFVKPGNLQYFRSGLITKRDEETGKVSIGVPLMFSIREYVRLAKWLSSI